jgi:hypothetical protein
MRSKFAPSKLKNVTSKKGLERFSTVRKEEEGLTTSQGEEGIRDGSSSGVMPLSNCFNKV